MCFPHHMTYIILKQLWEVVEAAKTRTWWCTHAASKECTPSIIQPDRLQNLEENLLQSLRLYSYFLISQQKNAQHHRLNQDIQTLWQLPTHPLPRQRQK